MRIASALFLCTFICICSLCSRSQSVVPIDSRAVISDGIKLHDEGKYKEAIKTYNSVPRNDTNYAWALYEKSYSYLLDSDYADCVKSCEQGLNLANKDYELQFFVNYGTVIDDQGDSKRAIRVYDSAQIKYPHSLSLLLNKAISLMRIKEIDEAERLLQSILLQNPFYASAHFRLAQCEFQKGNMVQAMMALYTYLLNSPSGANSRRAINMLNSISRADDDMKQYLDKRQEQPTGNYALLEQILLSRIALDKNYKLQTELEDPITRQLQVVMEKLDLSNVGDDFYSRFYAPLIKLIYDQKQFEPSVFLAFSNLSIASIQKYLSKNSKEIKNVTSLISDYLQSIGETEELDGSKRESATRLYHYENYELYGKGRLNSNGKMEGPWEFYFENGNPKSSGEFNSNGDKIGKWTYYYSTGSISGYDNWVNGVQSGEDLTYNSLGILITKANYVNGNLDGERLNYFAIGNPYSVEHFSNGVQAGTFLEFYFNGRKKIEASVLDNQYNGAYKSYFENGNLNISCNYSRGKLDGEYQSYYDNGKLNFKGDYKDDKLQGKGVNYYESGALMRNVNFVNDKIVGEEDQFNEQGQLIQKVQYRDGKADGLAEYYDDDGKLYCHFLFENDCPKKVEYFDKTGKTISTSTQKNKVIEITTFSPDGFKNSFGVYDNKGIKQGPYTIYYPSGKIKEQSNYIDGLLNGVVTGFFENGKKQYEITYKDNEKDGLTTYYYPNGQINYQQWLVNGVQTGDRIDYNEKRIIISETTYLNNDLYGYATTYFPNGKLDEENYYRWGCLQKVIQYDSVGTAVHVATLKNGDGKYIGSHWNGRSSFAGEYQKGVIDGKLTIYFFDGSVQAVKHFDHGSLEGDYIEYYYGGKIYRQGSYEAGKEQGLWKSYTEEGTLLDEINYSDGVLNGSYTEYYPSGKISRQLFYKNGERDSILKSFSKDGELRYALYYKQGLITGYSYNDRNHSLLPKISLPGGSGKLNTTYYNGAKSAEGEIADGKFFGQFRLYSENGNLSFEATDDYNIWNGKVIEYYTNGKVHTQFNYYCDEPDGPFKEYYETGILKEDGEYFVGVPNGWWKRYDATGKLTDTRFYYYGRLLTSTK